MKKKELLLDRDCAILDGKCDCEREEPYMTEGNTVLRRGSLKCKKYGERHE